MREIFDKLSIRTTDYFASIGILNEKFLSKIMNGVKGMACVGPVDKKRYKNLENIRVVKDIKELEESVFDKILAVYSEYLNFKELVKVVDHFGMVLIQDVPINKQSVLLNLLGTKAGIFETWILRNRNQSFVDLLFKVRKY